MKIILLLILLLYNHLSIAQKEEVHEIYSTFFPHFGDNLCRIEGYKIRMKDLSLKEKENLWRNYKQQCSRDGSYQLLLGDLYGSYGHYKEAKQVLEHSIVNEYFLIRK